MTEQDKHMSLNLLKGLWNRALIYNAYRQV